MRVTTDVYHGFWLSVGPNVYSSRAQENQGKGVKRVSCIQAPTAVKFCVICGSNAQEYWPISTLVPLSISKDLQWIQVTKTWASWILVRVVEFIVTIVITTIVHSKLYQFVSVTLLQLYQYVLMLLQSWRYSVSIYDVTVISVCKFWLC